MKILIASKNKGKVREIVNILDVCGVEFLSLDDVKFEIPEIIESGKSYLENALIKAREIYVLTGMSTLADDSGIEIDYLNGAPGVKSARFPTPDSSDEERCKVVLELLKNCPVSIRGAKFVCELVLYIENERYYSVRGETKGLISDSLKGFNGFGYDPIFIPDGYKQTCAELDPETKNRISHRFKALNEMRKIIMLLCSSKEWKK